MASRKLKVESVAVGTTTLKPSGGGTGSGVEVSQLTITFSRKLTQLEVSGVRAVMDGQLK
jgi:hypothetical protein